MVLEDSNMMILNLKSIFFKDITNGNVLYKVINISNSLGRIFSLKLLMPGVKCNLNKGAFDSELLMLVMNF